MRITLALALAAAVAVPAIAADTAQQSTMKTCASQWKATPAADQKKTTYKAYMSTCMKAPAAAPAAAAATPAKPAAPAAAMTAKPAAMSGMAMTAKPAAAAAAGGGKAKCKDGTVVSYKKRSGTCSGHKGVDTWM